MKGQKEKVRGKGTTDFLLDAELGYFCRHALHRP